MKRKWIQLILVCLMLLFTSGCLYPDDRRMERQGNPQEFIVVVQAAINTYQDNTGILPIKNSDMDTPIYEKYRVDFKKLIDRGYLSRIPANAFENGGTHYYVLVNVEDQPTVKLLDIISLQQVREIERLVNDYVSLNSGEIPQKSHVSGEWYTIDFTKIGKERVQVKSVYSKQYLSLLVHTSGEVVIEYAPEIMKIITRNEIVDVAPNLDLRSFLVEHSYYVPGQSNAYFWESDQPVISDQIQ
jgi:hypothetical protein